MVKYSGFVVLANRNPYEKAALFLSLDLMFPFILTEYEQMFEAR